MSEIFEFGPRDAALVIGLGRSGLASVEVLRQRGVTVYATDEKAPDELTAAIGPPKRSARASSRRPALPRSRRASGRRFCRPAFRSTSPVVQAANRANVPVIGEIEARVPPMQGADRRRDRDQGQVDDHRARRAPVARVRIQRSRRRQYRQSADRRSARRAANATGWLPKYLRFSSKPFARSSRGLPCCSTSLRTISTATTRWTSMPKPSTASLPIRRWTIWFIGNLDDPRIAQLHWRHGETRAQARQLWFTLEAHEEWATMFRRNGMLTYAPVTGDPRPVPCGRCRKLALPGEHNVQQCDGGAAGGLSRRVRARRCCATRCRRFDRCRTGSRPWPTSTALRSSTIEVDQSATR